MDLTNASCVAVVQTFLHGTAVQVQNQKSTVIGQLSWQRDDIGVFKIKLLQLLAFADFHWNLSERVVVEPQLLQIAQLSNIRVQLDDVIKTQIQSY